MRRRRPSSAGGRARADNGRVSLRLAVRGPFAGAELLGVPRGAGDRGCRDRRRLDVLAHAAPAPRVRRSESRHPCVGPGRGGRLRRVPARPRRRSRPRRGGRAVPAAARRRRRPRGGRRGAWAATPFSEPLVARRPGPPAARAGRRLRGRGPRRSRTAGDGGGCARARRAARGGRRDLAGRAAASTGLSAVFPDAAAVASRRPCFDADARARSQTLVTLAKAVDDGIGRPRPVATSDRGPRVAAGSSRGRPLDGRLCRDASARRPGHPSRLRRRCEIGAEPAGCRGSRGPRGVEPLAFLRRHASVGVAVGSTVRPH